MFPQNHEIVNQIQPGRIHGGATYCVFSGQLISIFHLMGTVIWAPMRENLSPGFPTK